MSIIMAAEHFDMTPAIRAHIERELERIADAVPGQANVRVFVSKKAAGEFSALYKVHVRGKDLVTEVAGEDLYVAITRGASQLRRRLIEGRRIRLQARKQTA